jgi:hypothetical protein
MSFWQRTTAPPGCHFFVAAFGLEPRAFTRTICFLGLPPDAPRKTRAPRLVASRNDDLRLAMIEGD